jgi:hypothetical protein
MDGAWTGICYQKVNFHWIYCVVGIRFNVIRVLIFDFFLGAVWGGLFQFEMCIRNF